MKTRALLPMALIAVMMTACVENEKDLFDGEKLEIPSVPLENFRFTEDFEVPVNDGEITVVTFNGEVIYEGNVATTIQVPKTLANTRAGGLAWHFKPNLTPGKWSYVQSMEGVVMFEDLDDDDFDYNDFVTRVKFQLVVDANTTHATRVQIGNLESYPKAMGATLPLTFGFEIVRTDTDELLHDITIYQDVREKAFDGEEGFINTVIEQKHTKMYNRNSSVANGASVAPAGLRVEDLAYNFYIKTKNGRKRYTADSQKAVPTNNGQPFGLFIPTVTSFDYPIERIPIYAAYPNFIKWLSGVNVNPFEDPVDDKLYHWQSRESGNPR